ncbi:formylglycine-generating enzyme family protein [Oerskovia jenensis]|uniref:Formylglycine-generating enzyme required for sulfatase activity n=1 Tax=Oerskovia jenensis TaxID=162169 RepID=A0ABS2LDW0_9CELL|nr:SUMF1/EgtB/PvdO family nonheme iron enzyme [Oerskovia jenensis]MBM7478605.1 formylglycine-generating enzyme required for sulfatase activity [Oerskovia jenensis]
MAPASTPPAFSPPRLVRVPGGALALRDARTGSARDTTLQGFEIGRTPVTWAEVRSVPVPPGSAPRSAPPRSSGPPGGPSPTPPDDVPAHPVTWFDAVRWCNAASIVAGLAPAYTLDGRSVRWDVSADGYRLPTEGEWEWACRAGTTTPTYGPLAAVAWTAADEVEGPQPVGNKAPNVFGTHDQLGNVWEWCWDYADTARYGDYRSLRGGGWADREWSVRASVRRGSAPDAVLEDVGFRVARGAVGQRGAREAQGWSAAADHERADVRGPRPVGWTPLRDLTD